MVDTDPFDEITPALMREAAGLLGERVKIAPDAHVKNCVIMQDGQVHSGAYIENCILDKQAVIKRNAKLIGPEAYPIVIGKNVII